MLEEFGALVPMAEEIALKLESEGTAAAVVNARFAKPIDVEMLEFFAGAIEVIANVWAAASRPAALAAIDL